MLRRPPRLFALVLFLLAAGRALCADLTFEVSFDPAIRKEPFTGRIIIYLGDKDDKEPRLDYTWTTRRPVFSRDVFDMQPGKVVTITDPPGYPFAMKDLPEGAYAVQAVMHTNPDRPHSGEAGGNLYSTPLTVHVLADSRETVQLKITRQIPLKKKELHLPRAKPVEMRSACLSKFHGRDIFLRAVLIFPEEYEKEKDRRFPAIYMVPGFGADHFLTARYASMYGTSKTPFVRIALDSTCAFGHHVYADSDNNGPYGRALIEEFIPHLEKEFRLIREPYARLLTGHSSGGWSTLWLQVSYPDYFGGTWSTSPDPVDFHDFTGVDIYDPQSNFYVDKDGKPRPIMRVGNQVQLWLKDFVRMEDVIGPGGQLHSFESVFGPRKKYCDMGVKPSSRTSIRPDQLDPPARLWNRETGKIDQSVVHYWKRYDIVAKLKREWPNLGPKLKGKIYVLVGEEDNFYLAGAAKLLKSAMKELSSDARIEIIPGKDHGNIVMTPQFQGMIGDMSKKFESATSRPAGP